MILLNYDYRKKIVSNKNLFVSTLERFEKPSDQIKLSQYDTDEDSEISDIYLVPDIESKPIDGLKIADWEDYVWDSRFDNWKEDDPKCWNKKKYMRPCMHDGKCKCGFDSEKGPNFWKTDEQKVQVWKDKSNRLYMKKNLFDKIDKDTIDGEIARILEIKSIN